MSQANESKFCPECGADCAVDAARCWMCQAQLSGAETVVTAEIVAPRRQGVSEGFFAVATFLLVGIALLIGIGLAMDEIGVAIVYALFAAPAIIATVVRVQYRKQKIGHVSWAERFVTLIVSASIVFAVLALLAVAAVGALVVYCMVSGPQSFH